MLQSVKREYKSVCMQEGGRQNVQGKLLQNVAWKLCRKICRNFRREELYSICSVLEFLVVVQIYLPLISSLL